MIKFQKTLITAGILVALILPVGVQTAYAQLTILPSAGSCSDDDCRGFLDTYLAASDPNQFLKDLTKNTEADSSGMGQCSAMNRDVLLGCAVKTGRITLNMIPYFITTISNFLLSLIGLICVLFIVIGGYYYIYGGLTEQKEKGKKTIYHALLGMSIAILSWVIVNLVIVAITS